MVSNRPVSLAGVLLLITALSTACAPEAVSEDAASRSDAPAGDLATQPPIANDSPGAPADEATADPDASDALSVDTPLTAHGWGPLRIGMTRTEVVAAAGEDANPDAVGGPDPERCDEFRPNGAPAGLLVMIENGRLSRVSIGSGSEVRTDEGIGIGDPASAVKEAYGASVTSTPHAYLAAPGEYVTVQETAADAAAPRGIVYEIGRDGRVSRIHGGGPSIQYAEGCI